MNVLKLNEWLESRNAVSLHVRSVNSRTTAIRSVMEFNGDVPPQTHELYTAQFLVRYENYLRRKGRALNTISSYMSSLRSMYNAAVAERKVMHIPKLFSTVFTGLAPTKKRALNRDAIYKLMTADLSEMSDLEYYRDQFVFSFCVQGIAYVDLAYLRKNDIKDGMLTYRRRKSRSMIRVPLTSEAKDLVAKYSALTPNSPYLFPIIDPDGGDERTQYESGLHIYNRKLKQLAAHLGIEENLSSYVARHSWATTAYRNDVSVSVVSQAMGHYTEEVTRIYLGSLDTTALSEANEKVMNAIMGDARKKPHQEEPQPAAEVVDAASKNVAKVPEDGENSIKGDNENETALSVSTSRADIVKRVEGATVAVFDTSKKKGKSKKKDLKWLELQKQRRRKGKK